MRNLSLMLMVTASLSGIVPVAAQEAPAPSEELKSLARMQGTWDATVKMSDGTESKGVSEFRMVCNGMWLESEFTSEFGGMAFEGKGLDSYDAEKKQFVSIWVDSMSTAPMILTGKKTGDVTTMTGEGPGPAGVVKYKTITTHTSADKFSFEMLMLADGNETSIMTVTYSRRKK